MTFSSRLSVAAVVAAIVLASGAVHAADFNVAVAANFTDAVKEIGAAYEKKTGDKAVFSFGATGALFTQISQGAPFDAFLSADQDTAKKAVDGGFANSNRFTYAVGKIVLWSKNKDTVKGEQTLKDNKFAKLSIANPTGAPYGAAAVEAMKKLGVYDAIQPKIVMGENITQAFQFVDTGNAELGFVALSQVVATSDGSRWVVSDNLYTPINQDAVLLKKGEATPAKGFIEFLKGPEAEAIIKKYGYGIAM